LTGGVRRPGRTHDAGSKTTVPFLKTMYGSEQGSLPSRDDSGGQPVLETQKSVDVEAAEKRDTSSSVYNGGG